MASRGGALRCTARLAGLSLLAVGVAGALGAVPTHYVAGRDGLVALGVGCGIAWAAGVVGSLPGCLGLERSAQEAALGLLAGSAIRFFAAAALAVPVVWMKQLPVAPLLLWIAVGYLVVLSTDTAFVVLRIKRSERMQQHD